MVIGFPAILALCTGERQAKERNTAKKASRNGRNSRRHVGVGTLLVKCSLRYIEPKKKQRKVSGTATLPAGEVGLMSICWGPKVHHTRRLLPSFIVTSSTGSLLLRQRMSSLSFSVGRPDGRGFKVLICGGLPSPAGGCNWMGKVSTPVPTTIFGGKSVLCQKTSESVHGQFV